MKKEKEVVSLMVSPDTGEVTNAIYYGDKIIRAETTEYLQIESHYDSNVFNKISQTWMV